jgi:hypothetical protein
MDDYACALSTSEPGLKTTVQQAESAGYCANGPVNTSSFQMTWGPTERVHAYISGIRARVAAGARSVRACAGHLSKGMK